MNLSLDNPLTPRETVNTETLTHYQLLWAEHENPMSNLPIRLNPDCKGVHVIAGSMWVTLNGEDFIVQSDETLHFSGDARQAVISNAGEADLIFELL